MITNEIERGFYLHLNKQRRRAAWRNALFTWTPPMLCAGAVIAVVGLLMGWWQ